MRKFILITFILVSNLSFAITSVYTCGLECGVTGTSGQHWNLLGSGAPSINTDASFVRSGARSAKFTNAANHGVLRHNLTADIFVVRFYIYLSSLPSANVYFYASHASAVYPFVGVVFKTSDSKIYAGERTATDTYSFGSSGVSITTGGWYRIDCKVNLTANPWTVDVQVDGSATSQYTKAVAATTHTSMDIGAEDDNTSTFYIDDFIASNTAVDYPIGPGYVNHFIPTSDGTHNVAGADDFERTATGTDITNGTTTAYQLLDEISLDAGTPTDYINLIAPPNATDYVEIVFGPAPGISTPTVAPRGVEAIVVSAAASATANNLRLAINDNGSTNDVRNATVGSTTCIYNSAHYSDPPSAASVWTLSGNGNFNNLRMRCYTSDAAPDPYFVGVIVEAEFLQSSALPRRVIIVQ